MVIDLPSSKRELISLFQQIHKLEKNEKRIALMELTTLWIHDRPLVIDFYSSTPYTTYQSEFAAYLYVKYGVEVYRSIRKIIPQEMGKVVTSWGDFMQQQIKYVVDIAWHQDEWAERHDKTIIQFSQDIEEVCDDDLYVTIMTKLVRTQGVENLDFPKNKSTNSLNPNDYAIDEEFFLRKAQGLPKNINGMREYVSLVNALAGYDAIAAMKAWGKFYHVFEEVYETRPPKKYSFSVALYNALYEAAKNSNEIMGKVKYLDPSAAWEQNDILARQKTDSYIYRYGWKYLHHAFEINTLNETDIIYNALSEEDKKKADKARDVVRERIKRNLTSERPPKGVASTANLQAIENALVNDPSSGIESWKACLKTLENDTKVSKPIRKKHLDDILYSVMNKQSFSGPLFFTTLPHLKIFHYSFPQLFPDIINDDWLTEYIFTNCQMISAPLHIAAYALLIQDKKKYSQIINILNVNKNIKDLLAFKEKVLLCATQRLEFMLSDVKSIKNNLKDNPNLPKEETQLTMRRYITPKPGEEIISVVDNPGIGTQLKKVLNNCKVISGV